VSREFLGDKWLITIFIFGILVYSIRTISVVAAGVTGDFYAYVIAAYGFAHGKDMYVASLHSYDLIASALGIRSYGGTYVYPPLTAIFVWPLTLLPLDVGATIWVFSNGIASLIASVLLSSYAESKWQRRLVLISLIGFFPVLETMFWGQVNGLVLLFTAAGLYFWRERKETLGGVMLDSGLWLKPMAIALVALVLWRKRWKAFTGILVASTVISIVSGLAFGFETLLTQFNPYLTIVLPGGRLSSEVVGADFQSPYSQSLIALLRRWLPADATTLIYWTVLAIAGTTCVVLLWPPCSNKKSFDTEVSLLIAGSLFWRLLCRATIFYSASSRFLHYLPGGNDSRVRPKRLLHWQLPMPSWTSAVSSFVKLPYSTSWFCRTSELLRKWCYLHCSVLS
jgi:hypothetical protein